MATWTVEFYTDDSGTAPFRAWMEDDLTDIQRDALASALRYVLAEQGIDVCRSQWGKALGQGLYEFRLRHTAAEVDAMFGGAPSGAKVGERVLLRVFFHPHGDRIVLLLGGYDKGADPSDRKQAREIAAARKRLTDFKTRTDRQRRGR